MGKNDYVLIINLGEMERRDREKSQKVGVN